MNKAIKILLLIGLCVGFSACARVPKQYRVIHDNRNAYLSSVTTQPLTLPANYDSSKMSEYFPVPNPQLAHQASRIDLLPPDLKPSQIPIRRHWWQ